jgi:hypothetical protein
MSFVAQLCPTAVVLDADSRPKGLGSPGSTPNQALLNWSAAQSTLTIFRPIDWVQFATCWTRLLCRMDLRSHFPQVLPLQCASILFPDGP